MAAVEPRAIGITVLRAGDRPVNTDIIFIHGINSTPGQCWSKKSTGGRIVLWPRDLLPNAIKHARIATFGYNSSVINEASSARIRDHAMNLFQDLIDLRKDEPEKRRPIVFVCHSLGGIVVKQGLALSDTRFLSVQTATAGIMFMGTPHRGTELASFGQMIANMARVAFKKPSLQLLEVLEHDSQALQDLLEDTSTILSSIPVISCFEQKETKLSKGIFSKTTLVVPPGSAKLQIPGEIPIPMNSDHHDICKFSEEDDVQYERVRRRIEELVDKAPTTFRQRNPGASLRASDLVNIDLSHDLPSRLVRLVGRELEIEILHAHLGDPADGQRVVLLSGLGGIGKTQLALHYLERYNTVYQAVFWVRSSSEKDIVLSFRDIGRNLTHAVCAVSPATTEAEAARAIGLPRADSSFSGQNLGYFDITTDDLIQAVKRYLSRRQNERWILVFDGWDSSDMIDIKTCFPSAKHGHILITTQQRDSVPWAISLELSGLNVQMGLKLLFHRLPEKFDQPLELRAAEALLSNFGGVPMAIEQAEAYLFCTRRPVQEYVQTFEKQCTSALEIILPTQSEHSGTIFNTLEVTFKAISLENDATSLLSFLSFFDLSVSRTDIISLTASTVSCRAGTSEPEKHLRKIRDILTDTLRCDRALHVLRRFCLLKATFRQTLPKFDIHPLVHHWARERLGRDQQKLNAMTAALAIARNIGDVKNGAVVPQRLRRHIDHVLAYLAPILRGDPVFCWREPLHCILKHFAHFYRTNKSPHEAKTLYIQLLDSLHASQIAGSDNGAVVIDISENLGLTYWELGDLDQAEEQFQNSLRMQEECPPADPQKTSHTLEQFNRIRERREHLIADENRARLAVSGSKAPQRAPSTGPREAQDRSMPQTDTHADELYSLNDRDYQLTQMVFESINLLGPDDPDTVSAIIKLGISTKGPRPVLVQGALQAAALYGLDTITRVLLDRGVAADNQGRDDICPLEAAVIGGTTSIVSILLEKGARSDNAFNMAVQKNKDAITHLFLQNDINVNIKSGEDSQTPLHRAAKTGNYRASRLLLDHGADIEATDHNLRTALHEASRDGHFNTVKLLLDYNADVEAASISGGTPIHLAADRGHETILQLLLSYGADIEAKDENSRTALHLVAGRGRITVVRMLLYYGANVNSKGKHGGTALHMAARNRRETTVELLLAWNADHEAKDHDGWTALHLATRSGNEATVLQLLRKPSSIDNTVDNTTHEGKTALFLAAECGFLDITIALLQYGAAIEGSWTEFNWLPASYYGTPLQVATLKGHKDVVSVLLVAGANVLSKDIHGWTPLLSAYVSRDTGVQALFKSYLDIIPVPFPTEGPSKWSEVHKSKLIRIGHSFTAAKCESPNSIAADGRPLCYVVQADHPFCRSILMYFEVTIISDAIESMVALGLSSGMAPLNGLPGSGEHLWWGYHGSDGGIFYSGRRQVSYEAYYKGDVVGCGLNMNHSIFFTKNGKKQGALLFKDSGQLFPVVGMANGGQIIANFGPDFLYTFHN